MQDRAVSPHEYKKRLYEQFQIHKVHNYYGMAEQTGCIYMFNSAWKAKMLIIDRINTQLGWFKDECYYIVDTCNNYCDELDVYSWKEDKDNEPEDGNDHMVNSCQYSWIPFVNKIGVKK